MMSRSEQRHGHPLAWGFTLIEVLVVVVILAILAAIVLPAFAGTTDEARKAAFIKQLKIFADAAEMYTAMTGEYLEDSSTGVVPQGFESYIRVESWTRPTPIGGRWDAERYDNGITSGVGVHFQGGTYPGDEYMLDIDRRIDDNSLATGAYRQLQDQTRYYYIIAE